MPLWCAADHSHEEGGETVTGNPLKSRLDRPRGTRIRAHSRVVRISPGDSVVLNSAERAPFLLHVEILEGDLDFDPTRRDNRELLKKIVMQEDLKRRKREHGGIVPSQLESFASPIPGAEVPPAEVMGEVNGVETEAKRRESTPLVVRRDTKPEEVEEMDLVEQLYGAKLSVRDALPDLAEIIPLSNAPRNKQLDVAAWDAGSTSRRPSSTPNTPGSITATSESPNLELVTSRASPIPGSNGRHRFDTPSSSHPPTPGGPGQPVHAGDSNSSLPPRGFISLEDYSERMRTAAVMLAQLHASQVPTVPEASVSPSGPLRWIPGTGWITGSTSAATHAQHSAPGGGPDANPTSAGGKLKLAAAQAAAIRERIMEEMMALEEERVERMMDRPEGVEVIGGATTGGGGPVGVDGRGEGQTAEDEGIVRRELNKADPSGKWY
jgi:hypothetical protein